MTPLASTTARPPRLVLRFAVYSAIALALAWVAIFWVVRRAEEANAREDSQVFAVQLVQRTADNLRPSDFQLPMNSPRKQELDELFEEESSGTLLRVKLVDRQGVVTFSDDQSLIGTRTAEPDEVTKALSGDPVHEVADAGHEGGTGADTKVLESWVPVYIGDEKEPVGALEIFQDYESVAADVRETVTPIAIALALALLLLYAALFPILRQVTRALDNRHKRLEEHASALTRALDERRSAEVRLTQAERNYRSLVEQLPLVMYITRLDETSSCTYMSPQIEELTGYTALECMSDPSFLVKMLHPEDRERTLEERRRAAATGESFATKYRIVGKDRQEVWIHDEVTVAKDESGRPIHAQGFLVDVTPQVTARHQLEGRHAELEALHETALALIDELDVQKLLEQIARQAGELIGTSNSYVYLRDDDELRVAVGTGVFAGNVGHRLAKGEGLAGRVWESGEALTIGDYQAWEGRKSTYDGMAIHGVAGVPLRSRTEVVGVLGIAYGERGRGFDDSDIALLSRFAHLASLALESARLYTSAKEELAERRRAESAVREAELRYRTLVEHLPLVTYISPVEETVGNLYVSPQVEELLGYPTEEWVKNPNLLSEAVHPDDLERVLAEADHLRETGEPLRSEYRYVTADGRTVWVLDETILVRNDEGTPLWVQGFILDITERRNAEETRARLAAIIESSSDAIMSGSLDLRFTSWNEGAQRMFGYTADEVIGKPITLLMPEEYQEEALSLVDQVVQQARVVKLETVRHHEDGSEVHVAFTYSPIRDSSGKVVGLSAIGQDVTERKRAEAAIRESEAKFRAFVETTEEWVWASDANNVHTYSNPAVERILGITPEELIGRKWLDFVVEEDREQIAEAIAKRTDERTGWSGLVIRWRHADGSVRHLESNATPVLDADGNVVGWQGTDRDVTHRIQAERDRERLLAVEQEARAYAEAAQRDLAAQNERLRELDRLKDEFIALVSHELRTPLTSIRGYTELLLDGEAGKLTGDQRQFLGVVERNAHRLLHLVGDLLFLAQVEAGKLVLDIGALDLGNVASESVEAARPQAEAKDITLTLATGPVPLIAGDRARIAQLLDNLVSNAIKFTPEGGRVDVRIRTVKNRAVLEVRDSGMGIPAGEQEFLFQRFFRTSTATEQAIQGTGLGLAISKAIVEAHSGGITVASEEGAGTTFRVTLPLHRHAELPERTQVAS
ncbi:MAG TPA: PAS domain S-box protein [Gaiellaceae bacterium]|nr:PAS domain S-box protein [Gaiellaceae bacterium]